MHSDVNAHPGDQIVVPPVEAIVHAIYPFVMQCSYFVQSLVKS